MKRFLLLRVIPIVLFAVLLGYLILNKTTYVLLRYEDRVFETSLWFFGIVVILACYFLFRLLSILSRISHPTKKWNNWKYQRRSDAAIKDFYLAMVEFEQGAWKKALKRFQIAADYIDRPIVAYLFAARCAAKLGQDDLEKDMLHQAIQSDPNESLAVGIVRAELLKEAGQLSQAKFVLNELEQSSGSNPKLKELIISLEEQVG